MRRIHRYMNQSLQSICKRVLQLEELDAKLQAVLPSMLQGKCHVKSFNQNCLSIIAVDPVWATQLHYCLPEIRDKLRKEAGIYQLTSIKVTVSSSTLASSRPKSFLPSISTKAQATIIAEAEQCHYAPLKEALIKLVNKQKDTRQKD
jgi:hypothetical protein